MSFRLGVIVTSEFALMMISLALNFISSRPHRVWNLAPTNYLKFDFEDTGKASKAFQIVIPWHFPHFSGKEVSTCLVKVSDKVMGFVSAYFNILIQVEQIVLCNNYVSHSTM